MVLGPEEDYFGTLINIMEFQYGENKIALFKCGWYRNTRGVKSSHPHDQVELKHSCKLQSHVYVLARQAVQVYYILTRVHGRPERDGL